jgi:hypothetical protein
MSVVLQINYAPASGWSPDLAQRIAAIPVLHLASPANPPRLASPACSLLLFLITLAERDQSRTSSSSWAAAKIVTNHPRLRVRDNLQPNSYAPAYLHGKPIGKACPHQQQWKRDDGQYDRGRGCRFRHRGY